MVRDFAGALGELAALTAESRDAPAYADGRAAWLKATFDFDTLYQGAASVTRPVAPIVQGVGRDWLLLDNPRRSANFAVLRSGEIPSVLVETGFLSNAEDERLLADPAGRRRVAAALRVTRRERTGRG